MTTLAVIQARMGSSRLPGKVAADLGGRPMLRFMLDRVRRARSLDRLVVATSTHERDDLVATIAADAGVDVVRGPELDVLGRFGLALAEHPADVVVRLTADCPLADPGLIDAAVQLRRDTGAAYASNTLIRTYPDGLDVEVVAAKVLEAAVVEGSPGPEREHVTPFVYRNPERFRLAALTHDVDLGHERWTVDTPEDLDRVRAAVGRLGSDDFAWSEAIPAFAPLATPPRIRPHLEGGSLDPARRVWRVPTESGHVLATVVIRDGGRGVLELDADQTLDPAGRRRVVDEVSELLQGDLQITELTIAEGTIGT